MNNVSKNYGLAGGYLDATEHVKAALPRLCNNTEQETYAARFRKLLEASSPKKAREAAREN